MSWLNESFDENTLIWLLLSSIIGGFIGAAITFVFEDVLRPRLTARREADKVLSTYTTPLLRSAERLENRINILVRNESKNWFADDEYFRLSTLFIFGEYFGWIRNIEREFGFVRLESQRKDREFYKAFHGLFRAMSSFAYFNWHPDPDAVSASEVPRLMCSAMGEAMTPGDTTRKVMDYTTFVDAYSKPEFQRWFKDLDAVLRRAHPSDPLPWDRLIAAAANLRALCTFLDPHGRMVKSQRLANLELIVYPDVRRQLEKNFPELLPVAPVGAGA